MPKETTWKIVDVSPSQTSPLWLQFNYIANRCIVMEYQSTLAAVELHREAMYCDGVP